MPQVKQDQRWRIVIGLGANLADRQAALRRAADELDRCAGTRVLAHSQVYESRPAGGPPGQPDYLNAAVLVETELEPLELLERVQGIERQLGRRREDEVRWGPRPIAIDLLWAFDLVVELRQLQIPHPRLTQRAFALVPVLELVTAAGDPRTGQAYGSLPIAGPSLRRVGPL